MKVIAVLDRPGEGVSGVSASTRAIAVMIPNSNWSLDYDGKERRAGKQ